MDVALHHLVNVVDSLELAGRVVYEALGPA